MFMFAWRGVLRAANWLLASIAIFCAVAGALGPAREQGLWAYLTVGTFVAAATLWSVRHPREFGKVLDDIADLFPAEKDGENQRVHPRFKKGA